MGACVCPSYGNPEAYTNCPLHGSRRETVDEVEARAERYRKALEEILKHGCDCGHVVYECPDRAIARRALEEKDDL